MCVLLFAAVPLLGIVYDHVVAARRASREAAIKADQRQLLDAAALFRFERGRRPVTIDELVGPYLATHPRDPWGRPYVLEGGAVLCTGPDGERGGGDDSWMLR